MFDDIKANKRVDVNYILVCVTGIVSVLLYYAGGLFWTVIYLSYSISV